MSEPTTLAPLVTDFPVVWTEFPEGTIPDGETYEHGLVEFENGYVVSILRASTHGPATLGFENGNWEVALTRPVTNAFMKMAGFSREPATELDHLNTHTVDGIGVVGDADNAAVNALLAQVQAAPRFVSGEPSLLDFIEFDTDTITEEDA